MDAAELKKKVAKKSLRIQELTAALREATSKQRFKTRQITKLVEDHAAEVAELKTEVAELVAELEDTKGQLAKAVQRGDELERLLGTKDKDLEKRVRALKEERNKVRHYRSTVAGLQEENSELANELAKFKKKVAKKSERIQELTGEARKHSELHLQYRTLCVEMKKKYTRAAREGRPEESTDGKRSEEQET